ncbi:MAG: hypothetical protein LBH43_08875 [Treponema sp.]|jgi:hypothetical protein|nr:hypothetical protein [Treponema sp.]
MKTIIEIIAGVIVLWLIGNAFGSFRKKRNECRFFNDKDFFKGLNSDLWLRNSNFCTVADSLDSSYEVIYGRTRVVSATNLYYPCCINQGNGCPICQRYESIDEDQLIDLYRKRRGGLI